MNEQILTKYVKPTIIDLASKLTNEWTDESAMQLHEALGDYLEIATCAPVAHKPEATITPEPVRIPIPPNTVCFPVIEEKRTKTKQRNTPASYRDRKTANARYQRLYDLLTASENIGKDIALTPSDIDQDCTMADLHAICKYFNGCTWRMKNAPNTKLMYKKQLMNVLVRFVRADQDLRALRFARA